MTNNPIIKQQLKERLDAMPDEITTLISSTELEDLVSQISSDFSLTSQQSAQLSNELTLTILFFCPITTLEKRIKENLNLEEVIAEQIYALTYHKIFYPREYLYIIEDSSDVKVESLVDKQVASAETLLAKEGNVTAPERIVHSNLAPTTPTQNNQVTTPQSINPNVEQSYSSTQDDLLRREPPPPQN